MKKNFNMRIFFCIFLLIGSTYGNSISVNKCSKKQIFIDNKCGMGITTINPWEKYDVIKPLSFESNEGKFSITVKSKNTNETEILSGDCYSSNIGNTFMENLNRLFLSYARLLNIPPVVILSLGDASSTCSPQTIKMQIMASADSEEDLLITSNAWIETIMNVFGTPTPTNANWLPWANSTVGRSKCMEYSYMNVTDFRRDSRIHTITFNQAPRCTNESPPTYCVREYDFTKCGGGLAKNKLIDEFETINKNENVDNPFYYRLCEDDHCDIGTICGGGGCDMNELISEISSECTICDENYFSFAVGLATKTIENKCRLKPAIGTVCRSIIDQRLEIERQCDGGNTSRIQSDEKEALRGILDIRCTSDVNSIYIDYDNYFDDSEAWRLKMDKLLRIGEGVGLMSCCDGTEGENCVICTDESRYGSQRRLLTTSDNTVRDTSISTMVFMVKETSSDNTWLYIAIFVFILSLLCLLLILWIVTGKCKTQNVDGYNLHREPYAEQDVHNEPYAEQYGYHEPYEKN